MSGDYKTVVNVHNPNDHDVKLQSKVALGSKEFVSQFKGASLGPDEVRKYTCSEINGHKFPDAIGPTENGEVQAMTTAVIFWQQLPDHPVPLSVQTGYYRSWCVDTHEGWRFRKRETHMSGVFHPKHFYEMPTVKPS